ncbi:MBL fold metallo-hydrolase [Pelomyxa schiedti]|nr:MBL fold metallo-hydrolase [Pelomyxa schiedti]
MATTTSTNTAMDDDTWISFSVGGTSITVVSDGVATYSRTVHLSPEAFFTGRIGDQDPAAPTTADLDRALIKYGYPASKDFADLPLRLGCVIVDLRPAHLVLIDCGMGELATKTGFPRVGKLARNIVKAGFDPAAVDIIILTHLHADHAAGAVHFPNAHFYLSEKEYTASSTLGSMAEPYGHFIRSRMTLLNPSPLPPSSEPITNSIVPGIAAFAAPGHTKGHIGVQLFFNGKELLCLGDMLHTELQIEHCNWAPSFDADIAQSRATRNSILSRVSRLSTPIFLYHLYGIGQVTMNGTSYTWTRITP